MCDLSKNTTESSHLSRRGFLTMPTAAVAAGMLAGASCVSVVHADTLTKDQRDKLTADEILALMKRGNVRFRNREEPRRDFLMEQKASAKGRYPAAVLLSCIDSRAPAEVIMDLGLGNAFNCRVAGNVANEDILGSMEFACSVAGAKVVLVMGHTSCGAIKGAIDNVALEYSCRSAAPRTHEKNGRAHVHLTSFGRSFQSSGWRIGVASGGVDPRRAHGGDQPRRSLRRYTSSPQTALGNLTALLARIRPAVTATAYTGDRTSKNLEFVDAVARKNVVLTMAQILEKSPVLRQLESKRAIKVAGAMYNLETATVEYSPSPLFKEFKGFAFKGNVAASVKAAQRTGRLANALSKSSVIEYTPVFVAEQFLAQPQNLLAQAQGDVALGLITGCRALGEGWELRLAEQAAHAEAAPATTCSPGIEAFPPMNLKPASTSN